LSNAASIHTAAISKLATLLGATYKEHTDIFDTEDLSGVHLENGYSVVLLDLEEKESEGNFLFMKRDLKIVITHRTYAAADATKVKTKLQTVYDKESAVVGEFRVWVDKPIGLIAVLPSTNTTVEKFEGGEDSFIVNTLNFSILYIN
jgi:hypothetical protein